MTNEKRAEKILEKLSIKRFLSGKNVSFVGYSFYEKNSFWTIEIRLVSIKKQYFLAFKIFRNSDNLTVRKGFFIIDSKYSILNNASRISTRLDTIF